MRASLFAIFLVVAGLGTGCFTTRVQTGAPAAAPTVENEEKWHSGVVIGIAELSGPYDLSEACPGGWAEIETETTFVNGIVQILTFGMYNPQEVTIRCQRGTPAPATSEAPSS